MTSRTFFQHSKEQMDIFTWTENGYDVLNSEAEDYKTCSHTAYVYSCGVKAFFLVSIKKERKMLV